MIGNRTIILTGAGAVIPWGAPTTSEITKALLKDSTFKSYTGQTFGDWVNHHLIGLYHRDKETVNFETIVNALEYLITYYSSKYRGGFSHTKNLMPAFFDEMDDMWQILWFDRIYEKNKGMWQSHNPQVHFYSHWNDYDYFFEGVFRLFINIIIKQIEDYSKKISEQVDLNNLLDEFLNSFKNPIRCYTTNYDRSIPAIFKGEMFEGFTQIGDDMKYDLVKVLTDETSNTYFNLHGSVHYDLDFPGNVKYAPNKYIYNFGSGASDNTDQDRRRIINSNIITGFNKPSRILTTPYSQFYLRFYQDCLFAQKIFVVGYSFGDFHINSAIKTASLANPSLEIVCVNYMTYDEDIDLETENDWIKLEGKGHLFLDDNFSRNIFEGVADTANVERISIYRKGFEQYLKRRQWLR